MNPVMFQGPLLQPNLPRYRKRGSVDTPVDSALAEPVTVLKEFSMSEPGAPGTVSLS